MTLEMKVMVGVPGCGKSTWAEKTASYLEADGFNVAIISRDFVRKSFVGEVDPNNSNAYFNREDEVFDEFIRQINEALEIGFDYVIVDATHISKGSRAKLLNRVLPDPSTKLVFEVMDCDVGTCLTRNDNRTGFAKVPRSAIRRMAIQMTPPTEEEFAHNLYGFKSVEINHYDVGGVKE